ncbi:hypothetical protein J4455_05370 [Candidatus Woesearchaeota archaeon]|nr:hypothetical protein [Candidatus Woesearchaeota archaeon]
MKIVHIVLVGERASGKDEFASYVTQKYHFRKVRFSDEIAQLATNLKIISHDDVSKKSKLQYAGVQLREKYGAEFYTAEIYRKSFDDNSIINGLRDQEELKFLKAKLPNLITIGIISDFENRFNRARQFNIVKNKRDLEILDSHQAEQQINSLVQQANYKIINNGTIEELHKEIDKVMSEILK